MGPGCLRSSLPSRQGTRPPVPVFSTRRCLVLSLIAFEMLNRGFVWLPGAVTHQSRVLWRLRRASPCRDGGYPHRANLALLSFSGAAGLGEYPIYFQLFSAFCIHFISFLQALLLLSACFWVLIQGSSVESQLMLLSPPFKC